jgi:hypothetical protein
MRSRPTKSSMGAPARRSIGLCLEKIVRGTPLQKHTNQHAGRPGAKPELAVLEKGCDRYPHRRQRIIGTSIERFFAMREEFDGRQLGLEELSTLTHLPDLAKQLYATLDIDTRLEERGTERVLAESECVVVTVVNGDRQGLLHLADRGVVDHEQPMLHRGPVLVDDGTGETQRIELAGHRQAIVEILAPTGKAEDSSRETTEHQRQRQWRHHKKVGLRRISIGDVDAGL